MLKGVYNDFCSLIRTDGQMSNRFIPKANRTERSIELCFSLSLSLSSHDEVQCAGGTSVPQSFSWKRLYSILWGLHTSILPLPFICRQVCDMTKTETSLWTWFLAVSSCIAVHKSSPCSFPRHSCVLLSQVMEIMWCKKSYTVALWQGQYSHFSLKRIWEKRLESNKLRTCSLYSSPKLCLKGLW